MLRNRTAYLPCICRWSRPRKEQDTTARTVLKSAWVLFDQTRLVFLQVPWRKLSRISSKLGKWKRRTKLILISGRLSTRQITLFMSIASTKWKALMPKRLAITMPWCAIVQCIKNVLENPIFWRGQRRTKIFLVFTDKVDDFETSHELFRNAFQQIFPWEVLKVYTAPRQSCFRGDTGANSAGVPRKEGPRADHQHVGSLQVNS